MSGGSHEYLDRVLFPEIFDKAYDDGPLAGMAKRLAELGFEDAARETEELFLMLRSTRMRAELRMERLHWVWHAIDYLDSKDWGIERVREAVAKYRGEGA